MDAFMSHSLDPAAANRKRRRPAWLPTLAALFFALLTAWLGNWQLDRAQQKRELQARYDALDRLPAVALTSASANWPDLLYRRVHVEGRFDAMRQIYLDNRIHQDRAGYEVLVPVDLGDGRLLVNRGWMPAAADRTIAPRAETPPGRQAVEGLLVPARSRFFELSAASIQGPVWENLDIDRYRAQFHVNVPDVVLLQTSPANDALVRDWTPPGLGIERHLGYAAQWFSLTAAIVVLYAYFGLWRKYRHGQN